MQYKNTTRNRAPQKTSISRPLNQRHMKQKEFGHDKLLSQLIATISSLYPLAKNSTQRKKIKHMKTRLANEGLNQTNRLDAIQIIKEHYAS